MDTKHVANPPSSPELDPFGGPNFTSDDDGRVGGTVTWTGDPSSVPLAETGDEHRFDGAREKLDAGIFGALLAH
jgi:hypothetical protein